MRKPEKVIRNGKVAVLYSPRYGAGWSTWMASKEQQNLALFDRRFVEAAEAGVIDIEPLAKEILEDEYVYCGGWANIKLEWLEEGTQFWVDEYDGSESLCVENRETFTA